MNVVVGYIVKAILDWISKIALAWVKKESKINKDKKAIDDQLRRLDDEVKKIENGETTDTKELIDAARDLANNF